MTITHSTVVVVADDGVSPVGTDEWNAAHTVADGSFAAAKVAFTATGVLLGRATAGAGNGEEIALTAAGRALLDDAAASDQRTTLGLGTAATQASTAFAVAGAVGAGFFGDGSDGAVTLQQTSGAPAWAGKSGSGATTTFTLSRDVFATTFDADDSAGNFIVRTFNYRIFGNTLPGVTIDAGVTVHNDGNAAIADAGGTSVASNTLGGTAVGSAGGVNTTATQATAVLGSAAVAYGSGAAAHGGTGGAATGGGTGGGVAGGNASLVPAIGSPRDLSQALSMVQAGAYTRFTGGGGGTGGNATGGTTAKGGGGGAGGGCVAIHAITLANNGIIRARGGAGGNGTAGNGTGSGGGGGGGGGAIVLVIGAGSTTGTLTVTGGGGGAPTGTGATGGTGVSGLTYVLVLS